MLPSAPLSAPRYLKLYPDKPSAATPKRAICLRFWGTGTLPRRSASRQSRAPLGFPEPERRRDGGCLKCHPGGFRVFFLSFFSASPRSAGGCAGKGAAAIHARRVPSSGGARASLSQRTALEVVTRTHRGWLLGGGAAAGTQLRRASSGKAGGESSGFSPAGPGRAGGSAPGPGRGTADLTLSSELLHPAPGGSRSIGDPPHLRSPASSPGCRNDSIPVFPPKKINPAREAAGVHLLLGGWQAGVRAPRGGVRGASQDRARRPAGHPSPPSPGPPVSALPLRPQRPGPGRRSLPPCRRGAGPRNRG